jgi:hypothetical protein
MDDTAKNEKLSIQFALTCASGALVIVGLSTFLGGVSGQDLTTLLDGAMGNGGVVGRLSDTSIYKPMKILMLGLPGAMIGGFLGYIVGDMMDNPRGSIPSWYLEQRRKKNEPEKPKEPVITGEEMFLDDLSDDLDMALLDASGIEDDF